MHHKEYNKLVLLKAVGVFIYLVSILISNDLSAQSFAGKKIMLRATNYDLDFKIDYENEKLLSTCKLTVTNTSDGMVRTIPLLLYRLLKVTSIKDDKEEAMAFTQQVLAFEDWDLLQVNFVETHLKEPIPPGKSKSITIEYSGYLRGYTETGMSYVKDKITPNFTIIRPDCFAYPMLGYPSFEVNDAAGFEEFDYKVQITVPDSLMVANGGKLISQVNHNGTSTYSYKNIKPAWRIDLAIARYQVLANEKLKIFYMPKDSIQAIQIMEAAKNTLALYTQWWGELDNYTMFSIIEIPDGWGSQADVSSIIQTAGAFRNTERHTELYHEISHLWNVKSLDSSPPRWNEGLAMFVQCLTGERFDKNNMLLEKLSNKYLNRIRNNNKYDIIPLIDYGKEGVTGYSYSTGMLMFHVLYELVGESKFNEIIKNYHLTYVNSGASTAEFILLANKISSVELKGFFNDWIYTTNYTKLINEGYSISDLVKYYKN